MDGSSFITLEGQVIKTSPMKDEHQVIKITEKSPLLQNIGKIVCGDTYSNILTFETNRYYDNVDLLTKNIKFIVSNELGKFTEDAVNLQYNKELIRFSWVLSDSVTYKNGTVTAAVAFLGAESGRNYVWKSLPFTIKVENSLGITDAEPPHKNWFSEIECRLSTLENGESGTATLEAETEPIDFVTEFGIQNHAKDTQPMGTFIDTTEESI